MAEKIKGTLPLALVIGVMAFLWCEIGFNFTFHWFTDGDLGNGLSLPKNFHFVVPAAFISWGFFFAAGADTAAFTKGLAACVTGGLAALGAMAMSSAIAPLPDFWGISLAVMVFAIVLVVMSAFGDWHYIPATFGVFATVFLWWTATGLDYWAEGGGGTGNSVEALMDPATAGAGAFGGVISTPFVMVWLNVTVSMALGCCFGPISTKLAALITPSASEAQERETVSD